MTLFKPLKLRLKNETLIEEKQKNSKSTPYRIRFTHLESNFSHGLTHAVKKP
jgi:hypothetical protein